MFRTIVALALALPIAATASTDPVIYDNGEPTFTGGLVMSNDRLPADDFIVGSSTIGALQYILTDVHFVASEQPSTGWDGRIRWFLFSGDSLSSKPGALIAAGDGIDIQREFVRILTSAVDEYQYSFDLDSPISLIADTTYWLALNMGPTNRDIVWRTSNTFDNVQGNISVLGAVSALPDPGPGDWIAGGLTDKAFSLTGFAVAEPIAVEIDIKPGSDPNSINLSRSRTIPVAILTNEGFDALDVDRSTVCFGAIPPDPAESDCTESHDKAHIEDDVDGDGDVDLVLHFDTPETGIAFGDTEACLTGETFDGTPFEACDAVKTVNFRCGLGYELAFLLPPLMWLRWHRRRRIH